jgi:hypothetical protein
MYFTVFMASLRATPSESSSDSDRSDTESAGHWDTASHLATIRSLQVLRSKLLDLQYTTDNMQSILDLIRKIESLDALEKYLEYHVAQSLKPEKQNPIRNLKQCWAGYVELSELDEDDLKEDLSGYQTELDSLIEFMNSELNRIKNVLKDAYDAKENLDHQTLREKFSKIQEVYYMMHLKVQEKLDSELKLYEEKVDLPHCKLGKYDDGFKAKSFIYQIYALLAEMNTYNSKVLQEKIVPLKGIWARLLDFFPHSFNKGKFNLDILQMISKAKGNEGDMPSLILFEWEMQNIHEILLRLQNLPKFTLENAIKIWPDKVLKIKSEIPHPTAQNYHQEQEKLQKRLKPETDDAVQIINHVFQLQNPALWPLILELLIHVVDASSQLGDKNQADTLDAISICPTPMVRNDNIEGDWRRTLDRPWLLKLIDPDPIYDQTLQKAAQDGIEWLRNLLKSEIYTQSQRDDDYIKSHIRWSVMMIRTALSRRLGEKMTPKYKNIFDLTFNGRVIVGETDEILGLKS